MGFIKKFLNQTRKPEGFLGKLMVNNMNSGHAKLADWGMSHLENITPEEILEIGCGGGRNAYELLKKYYLSNLTAIDFSDVSVEKATAFNEEMIKKGRCKVQRGDVSKLGFEEKYDLATAFETIYFWPGLEKCFSEVHSALKPGGSFLIVNEADGIDKASLQFENIIEGMKCYTLDEIEKALIDAGFSTVSKYHHENKPWITVVARK